VPHNLTHAALKSWAAEECLVWVRLIWRPLFQVLIDARVEAGEDVPEVFRVMQRVWELLEECMLPLLDKRGTEPDLEAHQLRAIRFIDYVNTVTLDGVRVFSAAYVTISFHQLLHMPQMVAWWGNLWEFWCFVFERIAGVYTQLIRRFNDRGQLSSFLFNRLALRDISANRIRVAESDMHIMTPASAQELLRAREEALMDAVVVADGPLDEGQLWSDWESAGFLSTRVVVPYVLNTLGRRDRGLVVADVSVPGTLQQWHRTNVINIDRIPLMTRTLPQVRSDPWTLNAVGHNRRLCGVMVDMCDGDGLQVLLVDGGAKLTAGDLDRSKRLGPLVSWPDQSAFRMEMGRWELVGCLLGAAVQTQGDSCPKVSLPNGGMLQLTVFPLDSLRRLIGLIRNQPCDLECMVVHPNEHFLMIPLTPGVMRTVPNAHGKAQKTVVFLGLDSIARCEAIVSATDGDAGDSVEFDPGSWPWAAGIAGVAVEHHLLDEVVQSVQLLAETKPLYSQPPGIASVDVCKEMLPTGVAKMWSEVLRFRLEAGLSLKGLNFVDLGSGIGGVVLATLVMQADKVVSACGVEIDADLHDSMVEWLQSTGSRWPWMHHCTQVLKAQMINGDFIEHRGVINVLEEADVVFCNNYLFDPPNNKQPSTSLNDKLRALLCRHLRPNATLVTTSSLHTNRRQTNAKRPRENPAAGRAPGGAYATTRVVVTHRTFKLAPSDVSWHGHLNAYIASIP
jgi:hypothetical protein